MNHAASFQTGKVSQLSSAVSCVAIHPFSVFFIPENPSSLKLAVRRDGALRPVLVQYCLPYRALEDRKAAASAG
nr:hypothetical protein [Pseudomonas sp. P818]